MNRGKKAAPPRSGAKRSPKKTPVLDRLEPWEAQGVLRRLLAAYPNLGTEVEQISKSLLGEISLEVVADDVEDALRSLHLDDLAGRAGRHSWGYTEPSEAAWELLEEAVNPFLEDMKRRMDLGLAAEALEVCKGILLGLYSVRDEKADTVVGWAPDFLEETAAGTALAWCAGGAKRGTARRERTRLLHEFAKESTPEWEVLIRRVLSR
jgi:hypothetical protein